MERHIWPMPPQYLLTMRVYLALEYHLIARSLKAEVEPPNAGKE